MLRKALLITISTLLILLVGVGGMRRLMRRRTPPQRQVLEHPGKLVRVMTVRTQVVPITIEGFGTVRAKTEWSVVPEVSGTVVQLSPYLRAGLHVKKGELLFKIDPRSYRLTVQRIRAQIVQWQKEIAFLTQQRLNYRATLQIAQRNLTIADEELQRDEALVQKGTISTRERDRRRQSRNEFAQAVQSARNNLTLIGPQIEKTEAAMAVEQAQLAEAELQLGKTRLLTPFAGQVIRSDLALGEFVPAGREVARLYDTTVVEIPMAIALEELRWLPSLSPETLRQGAHHVGRPPPELPPATVRWRSGERQYTWQGYVGRWEAGLDATTRTLTLVIEIQEPWKTFSPGQQPPLQPGMFCQIEIVASRVSGAVVIPRMALHEQNTVFLAHEGTLAIRSVHVLHVQKGQAIITAGLQAGDKLVVSPLTVPVMGMKLRLVEVEPPALPVTPSGSRFDRAAAVPDSTAGVRGKR